MERLPENCDENPTRAKQRTNTIAKVNAIYTKPTNKTLSAISSRRSAWELNSEE